MRLTPGQLAPDFDVTASDGRPVRLADKRGRPLLLSFHRFAACPFCNLRVHRLRQWYAELTHAGLDIVVFFQSPPEVIARGVGRQNAPFPIVGDPEMHVYERYGVERSRAAATKARVRRVPDAIAALARGYRPGEIDGDPNLVPASFLIDAGGVIREAYYGRDIGDHLPMSRIRAFVGLGGRRARETNPARPS